MADSQELRTQDKETDGDSKEDDTLLFSGLGTLTLPGQHDEEDQDDASGGAGGGDGDEERVSDLDDAPVPVLNSSNVQVPRAVPQGGGGQRGDPAAVPLVGGGSKVLTPAEAGSLVADGVTMGVGRNEVTQHQVQGGSQASGDSAGLKRPRRGQVCPAVRRGNFCVDKDCSRAHPAICGDPKCFPRWRRDCPMWHARSQGNGLGADPGRARSGQSQGAARGQQQQRRQQQQQQQRQQRRQPQRGTGRQRPRQQQQQQQRPLPRVQAARQQQPQQQPQRQHLRHLPSQQGWGPPPLFPPALPSRPHHWQAAGPSYRDVVRGATGQRSLDQDVLLGRLAALERRLAELAGPCQPSPGMLQI